MLSRRRKIAIWLASVLLHAMILVPLLRTAEPDWVGQDAGPQRAMIVSLVGPSGALGAGSSSAGAGGGDQAPSAPQFHFDEPNASVAGTAIQVASTAVDRGADPGEAAAGSASASASAPPRGQGSTLDISGYRRLLEGHIARFRRPEQAGASRTVVVRFTVNRAGEMLDAWIARSSGDARLDQAALDTVARADPLPRIPEALPDVLEFALPVTQG